MAWWRGALTVRSDRRFRFEATPAQVWQQMANVGSYRAWWSSWLREFDAASLSEGEVWRCRIQPPVPYAVRFTVTLDEVDELRRVAAHVAGDIAGTARVDLTPAGRGTEVHLMSSLTPCHPRLRAFAVLGGPFVRRGHDWVLDTGAREFDRRAVGVPAPRRGHGRR